jgi:hypothetical protein
MTGAAIEIAVLASLAPIAATLVFFLLWIPWNVLQLRRDRRVTLAADDQVRVYAGALLSFAREHPDPPVVAFSSVPPTFHVWGIQAALNYPYRNSQIAPRFLDESKARALPADARVTFINWDRDHNTVRLLSKDPSQPNAAYIKMGADTPIWQLGAGWYGLDDYFRWTEPRAEARLAWPPDSAQFEVVINVSPAILRTNGYVGVKPVINGYNLGLKRFEQPGIETLRWNLPPRRDSVATVEFTFEPAGHFSPDPRTLGAPVVAFGFVSSNNGH